MSALVHFLLVYDHGKQELIDQEPFADGGEAVRRYRELERKYEAQSMIEVVLVGSDSIETVRCTHANYFEGSFPVNPYFQGILK